MVFTLSLCTSVNWGNQFVTHNKGVQVQFQPWTGHSVKTHSSSGTKPSVAFPCCLQSFACHIPLAIHTQMLISHLGRVCKQYTKCGSFIKNQSVIKLYLLFARIVYICMLALCPGHLLRFNGSLPRQCALSNTSYDQLYVFWNNNCCFWVL